MRPLGIHLLSNKKATQEYWGLCFTAEEAGSTISMMKTTYATTPTVVLQYSTDGITWNDFTIDSTVDNSTTITLDNIGDKVYFKAGEGGNTTLGALNGRVGQAYNRFVLTGKIQASGNVMSLLDGDNPNNTILSEPHTFSRLFSNCTGLTKALIQLPATTITDFCYQYMFYQCTKLTEVSTNLLPAISLGTGCYKYMFYECTSLTQAPELPATTLAGSCYNFMFRSCTKLKTIPHLPATELVSNCYANMFYNCTSLTNIELPTFTSLGTYCCQQMFSYCSKITNVSFTVDIDEVPNSSFSTMFNQCSGLVNAKIKLLANKVGSSSYYWMFYGCTSLKEGPTDLPATELSDSSYKGMFYGCHVLELYPKLLPAKTLPSYCYQNMFSGCRKVTGVTIEAETVSSYSLDYMFSNCYYCNSVTLTGLTNPFSEQPSNAFNYWLTNTSSTGTFYCPTALGTNETITRSSSACPKNWTVINID